MDQKELLKLCKRGKLKELLARAQSTGSQEKLKQGFEPDLSQPIHYAAIHGDLEVVRELVESCDCDPVCQNVYGITPLHCASYCGQSNEVEYLLKRCPSAATVKDVEGACPLVYLAYCMIKDITVHAPLDVVKWQHSLHKDRIPMFKLFLSFTDVQTYIRESTSPILSKLLYILRVPVYSGSLANMKYVVQTLKPLLKVDEEFNMAVYSCLKLAADKKRWDFVRYFLYSFTQPIRVAMTADNTKSSRNFWELTPFQKACKEANISVVRTFLDLDICKPDVMAIKEAIDRNHDGLVHYLLKSAKHPVVMDQYQYARESSFLSYVLSYYNERIGDYHQKPELVRLIASNGVNGRDVEGNTVLHLACKYSIMFLIEEHCYDQSALNNSNQLPLHIACSQCNLEVVKLVSSKPVLNVNTQDSDGNTPIHIVCEFRYGYYNHDYVPEKLQCIMYLVLEKECNINIQNKEGKLPVHILLESITSVSHMYLTEQEDNDLIQLITNSENLTVNAQDKDGNTPLHIALKRKSLKAALYLMSNFQCDVNLCNNDGYLPLHCAVDLYCGTLSTDHDMLMKVIKAVSKKCSQLHKQTRDGMTPLHLACKNEQMDVVRYLVFDRKCFPNLCDTSDIYNSLIIHPACKEESDIGLLKALANKVNVNKKSAREYYYFDRKPKGGNTPLHVACAHHNLLAIAWLKELNCDFTHVNFQGMLPLHIACSKSFGCVKLLSIQDSDMKVCDEDGNTPLHCACKHNLEDVVKYLTLNFKCDLTIWNKENELPLHLACSTSLEIVHMVSDSQLNLNLQTKEGNTPLHIACRAGRIDIVNYLIATCKCDPSMKVRNKYGRLPIHYACKHSLEMVKKVDGTITIDDLSSRSVYNSKRISVLDIACSYGSLDVVMYLINNKGCTLSALKNDNIALKYACGGFIIDENNRDIWEEESSAHPNVVEYLITECGYDPSVIFRGNYYGTLIVERACQKGNLDLMKSLTVLSVDIIDSMGNTPLHYASEHSCIAIAQFLVEHGCDQTILNHNGELALHIACHNSPQIVQMLTNCDINSLTENEDANSPLHIACKYEQEDTICYLVEKRGCNVNLLNGKGDSALHVACRESLTVVKLLKGCEVNSTDADGNTALHIACINKNYEIVKYLLHDELCSAEIHNNSGNLPLHIIVKHHQAELPLVKAILQKCDVNSKGSNGNTALHIACSELKYELIMLLLQDELCRADIPNDNGHLPLHCLIMNHNKSSWHASSVELSSAEKLRVIMMVADRYDQAAMTADHRRLTPMNIIIRTGCIDLLKTFYERSAVNLDQFLHIACKHKHSKVVRWLIDHGANTEITDSDGNTPEHICISGDHPSLETLVQLGTLNVCRQNNLGDTVLHLACQLPWHQEDITEHVLLFTRSFPDAFLIQNNNGDTPLHFLAVRKCAPKLLTLIKCSRPNQKNKYSGNTPLHTACKRNKLKFAELLLKLKCDPTIRNNGGELPLHIAASQSLELVKLLAKSVNINSQTNNGDTPLHIACRCHLMKIIVYLINELKCSVEILNDSFDSPFHLLLNNSHVSWNHSILRHIPQSLHNTQNASGDTILHIACRNGNVEVVSFLVESLKCSVNVTNEKSGATPLHFACSRRLLQLVQLVSNCNPIAQLKESSLPVDIKCVSGDTPLHIACRTGNLKIIKYLLMNGHTKALDICNSQDEIPFHLACNHDNERIIRIFIPCKTYFDCNAMNGSGDTPLHMAIKKKPTVSYIDVFIKQMKCKTDVMNKSNNLPLHIACRGFIVHLKVLKILSSELSEDQLSLQNSDGNTALHELLECSHNYHCSGNLSHSIQLLARKMPNLSICNKKGKQPIHLACRHQRVHVVKTLCDLLSYVKLPNTILHEACLNDNIGVLEYVTKHMKELDADVPNEDGDLPLHLATRKKRCVEGTILLIEKTKDVSYTNNQGNTPLHELYLDRDNNQQFYSRTRASAYSDFGRLKFLSSFLGRKDLDTDVPNEDGDLPLHLATRKKGCVEGTILLIEKTKDVNYTNNQGNTPLHELYRTHASVYSDLDRLKVLSSFLARKDIDLSIQNSNGQTSLHLICESRNYDLKAVLDSKKIINLNIQDNEGFTPLHILSQANECKGVQLLCSTGANPSVRDNKGQTPLTITSDPSIMNVLIECGADPQPLYDMHKKFFQTFSSEVPPPTPVKLLMIGNPSVGKTTLVHSLRNEGSEKMILHDKFEHTAGIVTTSFSSKIYGDVMFYDFAGQREYYASHDAIIHSTIKNVPPIVLILVNLTDKRKRVCSQILYWINFIAKRCASFDDKAHMVIVCSHADILESQGEDPSAKVSKLLESIKSQVDTNSSIIALKEILHMNCTEVNSEEMRRLQFVLKESTNQLRQGGVMHFNSHCFYVLLLQAFKDNKLNYVTLGHIIDRIKSSSRHMQNNPLFILSSDQKAVTQMCKDLDNRGHVMFIEHPTVIEMSWLVLNKQPLLNDLLGSLFAPSSFPQHRPLSYSTGVVPLSLFKKQFGESYNYTATMKLTFLARMEYCREITDKTVLESIVEQEGYSETDRYYFFPNLVSLERPTDKWNTDPNYVYKSGWLIQCTMEGDFFSPHFIQALLLRLIFAFVPMNQSYDSRHIIVDEDDSDEEESQVMALVIKRVCSVWKNGIYWREQNGVTTIVEVIDEKTLVLLMQCPQGSEVPLIMRRSSIISMVFNAKNEFCSGAKLTEYFLHPECVKHPFNLEKKMTFSILDIQNSIKQFGCISSGKMYVNNSYNNMVDLERLLYFEPYSELSAEIVVELFKEANSDKPVKHSLLLSIASQLQHRYQIFGCLRHIMDTKIRSQAVEAANDTTRLLYTLKQMLSGETHHHLREIFNQISIFCGRLPPQGL